MRVTDRAELITRDAILKLLSNEEIARVSTAETASKLTEGQEYLDLEHLDQGVQRANAETKAKIGNVLPRGAVRDETWNKILAQLAARTGTNQMQSAASRLYHDRGFMIHLTAYLAVNALLIVINLVTSPGKYWFYWPLLGWGIGIAGHAFGVLGRSKNYSPSPANRT